MQNLDNSKLFRLSLKTHSTVEDFKEAFLKVSRVEGGIWNFLVHKLRLDGKNIVFGKLKQPLSRRKEKKGGKEY